MFVAFSLDLKSPGWAMTTVYLTSQPLSGAMRAKAVYRAIGKLKFASANDILCLSEIASRAARSSGSGLAVMQPINLGSGEDPILDLDRCGALSRLGQIVQRDHCIAQRLVINQYVAVYERRWLARVGIDFNFFAAHVLPLIRW